MPASSSDVFGSLPGRPVATSPSRALKKAGAPTGRPRRGGRRRDGTMVDRMPSARRRQASECDASSAGSRQDLHSARTNPERWRDLPPRPVPKRGEPTRPGLQTDDATGTAVRELDDLVTLAAPEIDDDLTLTSSQSRWPSSCSSLLAFWEAGGTADASKLSGNDFLAVQPRPRLLDEGVLFLDQALLMVNCRAEAIKLLPAKRA